MSATNEVQLFHFTPANQKQAKAKPYLNRFPLELEGRGDKATVRGPELQAEVHLHNHSVTRMEICKHCCTPDPARILDCSSIHTYYSRV